MKDLLHQIISVVIPVFNMRDSINATLQSVVDQTYEKIDVVCVDDGSTDGSQEELKAWKLRDSRIRIITRQNGGLSAARNSGIDAARGNYIVFLDAGDVLHKSALEILLTELISHNADVSISKYFIKTETQTQAVKRLSNTIQTKNRVFVSKNPLKDFLKYKYILSSACNKLFRREAIGKLRFQEGVLFEDWPFITKIFGSIGRFVLVETPLYGYVMQSNSITRSDFSEKKIHSYVAGIENVSHFFSTKRKLLRPALKRCGIAATTMISKVWHTRFVNPHLQKTVVCEFWRLVRERKVLLRDIAFKALVRVWMMEFKIRRGNTVKKNDTAKLAKRGYEALSVVSGLLDRTGYQYHIDFGTLLGCIRHEDFINYDLDIDFSVYEDCDFVFLKKLLSSQGLKFVHCFSYDGKITELTMSYKNVSIDFFKNFREDDKQHYYFYGRFDKSLKYPHRTKQAVRCIRPLVTDTRKKKFAELIDVSIPINAEDLLERAYGADWRIPNPDWKCDFGDKFLTIMPCLGKKQKVLKS